VTRVALALLVVGCSSPEESAAPSDASVDTHVHDVAIEAAQDAHDSHVVEDTPEDPPPPPVPETLAETGLYKDFATLTLADGVTPFDVKYPLWSDGAEKSRWMWLPAGTAIDKSNPDHWTYPKGTKAWKEFRRDGKRIETRFLEKTGEGSWGWRYVAYAWSADGKTATAARLGSKNALGTTHEIPSQEHCDQCHSGTRDGLIGPGAVQFGDKVPPGEPLVRDVLGYLHGNCGYCHSDQGRWATARPARFKVLVADTDPKKTGTYVTMINVKMNHLDPAGEPFIGIVPGNPDKSHVYYRMGKRDGFWNMPPVGTNVTDEAGMARIAEWIRAL
jgi:hypothetical protein